MNETVNIILAFVAGLVLGTLFFVGLWFTVKRTVASTNPSIVILVSFVLRMAIVLVGFYLIGSGNLQRFVIALAGFIIARFLIIYFTKTKSSITEKEANHET